MGYSISWIAVRGKSAEGLYGDVVEEVDWSVGEILQTLKRNGLDSNTPFPGNKWVCLQWHYGFDPNGNKTAFLAQVDGTPVDKGMFTGPKGTDWQASAWKNLQIGWELFGSGGAPEFWVDDLAFGEQPIPCPSP